MTSVRLCTNADFLLNELADVVRLFLGDVPISSDDGEIKIHHIHEESANLWTETAVGDDGRFVRTAEKTDDPLEAKRRIKRAAKNAVFELLMKRFGFCPPWGSLTGIRPTRLIYEAMENGLSLDEAKERLNREFFVSRDKTELLGEIIEMQRGLILPPEDSFDLYIHIPFCLSRCAYCSFATAEIGKGELSESYLPALLYELRDSAQIVNELKLRVRAIYIGGGTPTAISLDALERIIGCAKELFTGFNEFTVEAGRPDTINREKLTMLKRMEVSRISVNPQTFSDETLKRIGRNHTSKDTLDAYYLTREIGFDDINMDLIAALPGEGASDFEHTLKVVSELNPDSVTVHSLAIKRSSKLHEQLTVSGDSHNQATDQEADRMVSLARSELKKFGYRPYYLYRQKYMAGNLENVGYAHDGKACLYNIGNMEETQRVLAVGAGAITKWIFDRRRRIERAPNLRNIGEYISRVEEMCRRKRRVILDEREQC